MPDLTMPALRGTLEFGADADAGSERIATGAPPGRSMSLDLRSSTTGRCSIADGMVLFSGLGGHVQYQSPGAAVNISAEGSVRIGGDGGFEASAVVELSSGELGRAGERTHSSVGLSHSTTTRQHHLGDERARKHEEEARHHTAPDGGRVRGSAVAAHAKPQEVARAEADSARHARLGKSSVGAHQLDARATRLQAATTSAPTAGPSARVVVSHPGGWKPFPCLVPDFTTPSIDGELHLGCECAPPRNPPARLAP